MKRYPVEISDEDAELIVKSVLDPRMYQRVIDAARAAILRERPPPAPPPRVVEAKPAWPHGKDAAMDLVANFCETNSLPLPEMKWFDHGPPDSRAIAEYSKTFKAIYVYEARLIKPVPITATEGMQLDMQMRSCWPGWIEDATALGAVAHELGHHVQKLRGWKKVDSSYYDPYVKETPISAYARLSRPEDFAECFRLFATNPTLLSMLCPLRFDFFSRVLNLRPVVPVHWDVILADSPQRVDFIRRQMGE